MNENQIIRNVGSKMPEMVSTYPTTKVAWENDVLWIYHIVDSDLRPIVKEDPSLVSMAVSLFTRGHAMTIAVKMGNLPWVDGAMHPLFNSDGSAPKTWYDRGEAIAICNVIVDGTEGEILHMHPFAATTHFSNYFGPQFYSLKNCPVSQTEFIRDALRIQQQYTSRQIGEKYKDVTFKLRQ